MDLSSTCSISLVIRCTCKITPELSAVDVGEERETLTVQSEAVGRWGVDLSVTCLISPAIHCTCKIKSILSAVGVREERGMLTVHSEAVERV